MRSRSNSQYFYDGNARSKSRCFLPALLCVNSRSENAALRLQHILLAIINLQLRLEPEVRILGKQSTLSIGGRAWSGYSIL